MADLYLVSTTLYRYKVAMKSVMASREGLLLQIQDSRGRCYFAEGSPLPMRSQETLEQALEQMKKLQGSLLDKSIDELLTSTINNDCLFSSVSFALFSALYQSKREKKQLSYPISALLIGSFDAIQKQMITLEKNGFTSVKLKTSHLSADQTHLILDQLLGKYNVRLDLNRAWDREQTLDFFDHYSLATFDYVEEPFPLEIHHPLAYDESLMEEGINWLHPHLRAMVIKPTILGVGPLFSKIVQFCKNQNKIVSLSSSFETGLGLFQIALIAEHIHLPPYPLGLDTYRFIQQDLIKNTHIIQNGIIYFQEPEVDITALQKGGICTIC